MAEVRVASVAEFGARDARRVDADGHRVAVVRIDDTWYAIGDRCSHAEASLAEGGIDGGAGTIECPKHNGRFDAITGAPTATPARIALEVFETEVIDGDVRVRLPVPPSLDKKDA